MSVVCSLVAQNALGLGTMYHNRHKLTSGTKNIKLNEVKFNLEG